MSLMNQIFAATFLFLFLLTAAGAQGQSEEMLKAREFFTTAGIPGGRWTEGETLFPHVAPAAHFFRTMLYYHGTEELQDDEIRVAFMGSIYFPNASQSGMSILVELGNGDRLVFDLGIGSLRNYNAYSIPYNSIKHVFISHLHMDHVSDLPFFTMFRGLLGGWDPLHVYGPSGAEPQYGTASYVQKMLQMTAWHQDSFHSWPVGEGYNPEVHEFDYMDEGGVIYDNNGARVIHWPTSHTKDGASSYRLDWNGRSLCYTGDNRPNSLTIKYCKGVDLLISEVQVGTISMSAQAIGMPVAMAAYTIDTSHTPAYALGYICEKAQPKVCVGTHYAYDDVFNTETVAEVRHHWKGPFAFGAPDLVTFNLHGDGKVWWREGAVAGSSQTPQPAFTTQTVRLPAPRHQVHDVINETIRNNEIDPELWYPPGHKPVLVREWPLTEEVEIPNPFAKPVKSGDEGGQQSR